MSFGIDSAPGVRVVDITAPGVAGALDRLAGAIQAVEKTQAGENKTEEDGRKGKELLLKISPPLFIHVAPLTVSKAQSPSQPQSQSPSQGTSAASSQREKENQSSWDAFLSAWTGLVGDPVLSKWISLSLALSLALNAVLMRGIAAGALGGVGLGAAGVAASGWGLGVRFSATNLGVVREVEEGSEDGSEGDSPTSGSGEEKGRSIENIQARPRDGERRKAVFGLGKSLARIRASSPMANSVMRAYNGKTSPEPIPASEAEATVNTISVDTSASRSLFTAAPATATKIETSTVFSAASPSVTAFPPTQIVRPQPVRPQSHSIALDLVDRKLAQVSGSTSTSSSSLQGPIGEVRSLEECLEIFENGPRPVSASLVLLNDEEIVMLSQNGKIQAYALEKMLGDFERAVKIRRALICEFL